MIRQPIHDELLKRLKEKRRFLHPPPIIAVLSGFRERLVGGQGITLEEFLSKPAAHWLS